ncbi:orotate phosphoribosyltransferase [Geminicoccus roseus]|uniref:orotate phosphoribosyltransferase n=1 Tax=Geminicoccus roseus TaxID=404900 RepID=UPI00041A1A10|nr:orotate phosphoribosyltransferase [Geminicoccus roseus]
MDQATVMAEFEAAGALLRGHFILTSGLRSSVYLQCARVLMDPARAERLAKALAARIGDIEVDLVVAPAMGGILVGHELARALGVPSLFTERVDGTFTLRRGFSIPKGAKVVVAEDVVTTGMSTKECMEVIRAEGGQVVAAACLVDRSGGRADLGVPHHALMALDLPTYRPDELPPELAAIPPVKPGSRPGAAKA